MIALSRFRRKCIILYDYLYSKRYLKDRNAVCLVIGITGTTLAKWRDGEVEFQTASPNLAKVVNSLRKKLKPDLPINIFDEDVLPFEFSRHFGHSMESYKTTIDRYHGLNYPTYNLFFFDSKAAYRTLSIYQGFYLIYRMESEENQNNLLMQIPLCIRYMLPSHKSLSESEYRIRCKMAVRSYRKVSSGILFEYDGYISGDNYKVHHWLFESRLDDEKDLIYMLTSEILVGENGRTMFKGSMISRDQSAQGYQTVWPIIGVKCNQEEQFDLSDERLFIKENAVLITPSDKHNWIIQILKHKVKIFI